MKNPFEKAIDALKLDDSIPLLPGEKLYQDFINLLILKHETLNQLDCELIGVLPDEYRSLSYIRSEVFTRYLYAILMFRRQNGGHARLEFIHSQFRKFYLEGTDRNKALTNNQLMSFICAASITEGVDLSGLSIENFILYVEVITIKFLTPILEQIETLLHSKES